MRKLVIGILAHVDAGKTTLSEGLLYTCGALQRLGRVDHQDAFLDTEALERERGITIFSKQAVLPLGGVEVTLLDTPGHVDFSSGDGAHPPGAGLRRPGHQRHGRGPGPHPHPVAAAGALSHPHLPLCQQDGPGGGGPGGSAGRAPAGWTAAAWTSARRDPGSRRASPCATRRPLERYLEPGAGRSRGDPGPGGRRRRLFPCWFGSALKLEGVAEFLEGVEQYAPGSPLSPGVRGPGVQDRPGRPGGPADLPEDHRGQPAGEDAPDRRGGGGCAGRRRRTRSGSTPGPNTGPWRRRRRGPSAP